MSASLDALMAQSGTTVPHAGYDYINPASSLA
jgi:hypothetical protein